MIRPLVISALALTLAAPVAMAKKGDKVIVRAGTVAPEGTPWEQQMKQTRRYFRKASDGRIKVKVYFGGQKGDEKSLVRQCRDGRLEIVGVSTAALATEAPELRVLELPFLFDSTEMADYILDDNYDEIKSMLLDYDYVMYQWAENGWQNIGMKDTFVKAPTALQGRKIRSQEAEIHLATWKAFGASPVEMPVSEVLQSLNTGRVDGFAQTPLYSFAAAWYRGIKFYSITKHLYQPAILVYSKKFFDKQEQSIQDVLISDVENQTKSGREGVRRLEPALLANFKNYGIQVYELTDKERESFSGVAKEVRAVFEKSASKRGLDLLKSIEKSKAKYLSK